MLQEMLNGFPILCIEKDNLDKIDLDSIINDFASKQVEEVFSFKFVFFL